MADNYQNILITELKKAVEPIVRAADDEVYRDELFGGMGWQFGAFSSVGSLVSLLGDITTDFNTLVSYIETPPSTLEETRIALDTCKSLFESLEQLNTLSGSISYDGIENFGTEISEYLIAIYLHTYHLPVYHFLNLIGLMSDVDFIQPNAPEFDLPNERVVRRPYSFPRFLLQNTPDLLNNPSEFLKLEYSIPAGGIFADLTEVKAMTDKLFSRLATFLQSIGVPTRYSRDPSLGISFDPVGSEIAESSLAFVLTNGGDDPLFGVVMSISPVDTGNLGVVLVPFGSAAYEASFGQWTLNGRFDAAVPGIAIGPQGVILPAAITIPAFEIGLNAGRKNIALNFGSDSQSRLMIEALDINAFFNYEASRVNYGANVHLQHAELVLHPGNGDGFLSKVLPEEGLVARFELLAGWDSLVGLHLSGSGSLEVEIPIHASILGALTIDSAKIAIRATDSVSTSLGIDASLKIGPLSATITDAGLKASFTFPAENNGNLGPLNVDLDFKAPSGVGISINSPVITGGGFLSYTESTKTYAGALELSFKKFSLQAYGIVSTQLPDGSEGYSLLIFITAQFQPIPIGMGFTLNGVGGMLGLNRSTNVEFLRAGVRDNTLRDFLFPDAGSIVANASSLISTANQAFPIQEGRFVFGPLAKLGWGSPNILTIDLGIVIEVPDPVTLAILGVLKAILPDESKQTLKLQVNFLGLIDFDKKQLSFDATIFDSKLLNYALSGDMALRIAWGNQPNFLLSVGGFHPQFTPPPLNLPELRRIAVQIFNEENLRVRFETYFALTSNSAQFGAKLDAYAAAGKFNATALLWFDVLFQFSPFHMIAGMGVEVAIRRNDKVLFGAYLSVTVSGPGPWRVWGEVAFEFCKCNFSIHFDKTFGEGVIAENASVDVLPQIQAALDEPKNWTADLPERNNQLVALNEPTLDEGTLFVSPSGNLTFRQQGLPLDVLFSKFGNAKLHDYKKFSIINVRDANDVALAAGYITDFFAANEFYYLTDAEKLARPSYELYKSGVSITGTSTVRSSYAVHREFAYEQIEIDIRVRNTTTNPVAVNSDDFEAQLNNNTISQSPFAANNHVIPHNASPRVSVDERTFTLVSVDDMSPYNTVLTFTSETEAEQYLSNLVASNTNLLDQLIVVDQLELVA